MASQYGLESRDGQGSFAGVPTLSRPNLPRFAHLDEIMAKNRAILQREKRRGRPNLDQKIGVRKISAVGNERAKQERADCSRDLTVMDDDRSILVDLEHIRESGKRSYLYWTTCASCECDFCGTRIEGTSGIILQNCRKHRLCRKCIHVELTNDNYIRQCPVLGCQAPMMTGERIALRLLLEGFSRDTKHASEESSEQNHFNETREKEAQESQTFGRVCPDSRAEPNFVTDRQYPSVDEEGPRRPHQVDLEDSDRSGRPSSPCRFSRTQPEPKPPKPKDVEINLGYLDKLDMRGAALWPVESFSKCSNCQAFGGGLNVLVLKNCRKHKICRHCAVIEALGESPKCPIEYCGSVMTAGEIQALQESSRETETAGEVHAPQGQSRESAGELAELADSLIEDDRLSPEGPWILARASKVKPKKESIYCHSCNKKVSEKNALLAEDCKHSFCKSCADYTVSSRNRCPLCNKKVRGWLEFASDMWKKLKNPLSETDL